MPCALSKGFFGSQRVLSSMVFPDFGSSMNFWSWRVHLWLSHVEHCHFLWHLLGWFGHRPFCPWVILWMKRVQHYVYICLPRLPGDTPPGERYAGRPQFCLQYPYEHLKMEFRFSFACSCLQRWSKAQWTWIVLIIVYTYIRISYTNRIYTCIYIYTHINVTYSMACSRWFLHPATINLFWFKDWPGGWVLYWGSTPPRKGSGSTSIPSQHPVSHDFWLWWPQVRVGSGELNEMNIGLWGLVRLVVQTSFEKELFTTNLANWKMLISDQVFRWDASWIRT